MVNNYIVEIARTQTDDKTPIYSQSALADR